MSRDLASYVTFWHGKHAVAWPMGMHATKAGGCLQHVYYKMNGLATMFNTVVFGSQSRLLN